MNVYYDTNLTFDRMQMADISLLPPSLKTCMLRPRTWVSLPTALGRWGIIIAGAVLHNL